MGQACSLFSKYIPLTLVLTMVAMPMTKSEMYLLPKPLFMPAAPAVLVWLFDPSIPLFTPGPGHSANRQPKASKEKARSKTGVGTSKEEIAHEFSRIEFNTIRAKLTTLDTKNIDLEFQNSILLERVSAFEKAEKDAIYEKYFLKPGTLPSGVGASSPS